jgi:preprotein translocase subunit SecE
VNRETKRMMERRGRGAAQLQDDDDFEEVGSGPTPSRAERQVARQRTNPLDFARQIREELRQVAWPTRTEMVNYSTVVFVTLVVMILLIFLLNYVFGKGVVFMFTK